MMRLITPVDIAASATLNTGLKNCSEDPPTKGTQSGHLVSTKGK